MNQNNQDIWSKVFIIERDLLENQRNINKIDSHYNEVLKKLEQLKEDLINQKDINDLEDRIQDLENLVDILRQEMPEIRLIKKLFFSLVAFVLISFLGLIWNSIVINSSKGVSMNSLDLSKEFTKKVIEEYNREKK